MPYTEYRNDSPHSVLLCGVGTFASAIVFHSPINISLRVALRKGGREVVLLERALPGQHPQRSLGKSATEVIALDAEVAPGTVISSRMSVHGSNGTRSFIYDGASFLLTDAPDGWLVPSSEVQLWPQATDWYSVHHVPI